MDVIVSLPLRNLCPSIPRSRWQPEIRSVFLWVRAADCKHWPVSDADDIDDTGALLSHILGHRDSCAPQAPEIRRQRWQRHQLRQKGSHPAALCGCVIMDSVRETRRDLLLRLCRLNQDFRNGYARVAAFVYWVSVLVRGGQFRNHGKTTYSADDSRVLNLFRHNAT